MAAPLSAEVLQDELAISVARVLTAANKRARELGMDVSRSLITVSQAVDNGTYWRVNYGPRDYIGRRGGDLIIEVDAGDASIKRVLRGQ